MYFHPQIGIIFPPLGLLQLLASPIDKERLVPGGVNTLGWRQSSRCFCQEAEVMVKLREKPCILLLSPNRHSESLKQNPLSVLNVVFMINMLPDIYSYYWTLGGHISFFKKKFLFCMPKDTWHAYY